MTIADKLITTADNTIAIAEAINGSKVTVSGTCIVADDVLGVPHKVEVNVSEGAEVKVYGKNIFNYRSKTRLCSKVVFC